MYYKTQLHDGEVEVMILAKEKQADLIIVDDNNAKKHAKYLGLPVTGTIGVLIKAKNLGIVSALKPLLERMLENHIYMSSALMQMCLEEVGEVWNIVKCIFCGKEDGVIVMMHPFMELNDGIQIGLGNAANF